MAACRLTGGVTHPDNLWSVVDRKFLPFRFESSPAATVYNGWRLGMFQTTPLIAVVALTPFVVAFSPDRTPPISRDIARVAGVQLDPSVDGAARLHASDIIKDRNRARWERVKRALRRAGVPDAQFWPVAVIGRSRMELMGRLRAAVRDQGRVRGATHMGIGIASQGRETAIVVLFLRRLVQTSPLPKTPTRTGLVIRGRVTQGRRMEALLMGPCQDTKCAQGVRSLTVHPNVGGWRFSVPPMVGEGTWTLEVMVDTERGPEPAVLWEFFEGVKPAVIVPQGAPRTWVQAFRAEHELAPLKKSSPLAAAARRHAEQVCARRFAAHILRPGVDPQHRARDAGYRGDVTENVAVAPTSADAHRNLLLSPSHRRNLLDPMATDYGMAIATASARPGARPIRCWVELFGQPKAAGGW